MKMQAVPFQQKIVWKDRGDKFEAFKGGIFQLSVKECKIHFKNGWSSQKYKNNEEAKSAAESMLLKG
jgi:hypothetical protein